LLPEDLEGVRSCEFKADGEAAEAASQFIARQIVVAIKPRKWTRLWPRRVKEGRRITFKQDLEQTFYGCLLFAQLTWDGSRTVRDSLTP
jgi:hypothetical protein